MVLSEASQRERLENNSHQGETAREKHRTKGNGMEELVSLEVEEGFWGHWGRVGGL